MKQYDTSEITFDYDKLVKIFTAYSILEEPEESTEEEKLYTNIVTWNDYVINKKENSLVIYPGMQRERCISFDLNESISILNILRVITQNQQDYEKNISEADERIFSILNIKPVPKYSY